MIRNQFDKKLIYLIIYKYKLTGKFVQFKLNKAPILSNLNMDNQSNEFVFKKLNIQLYS